MWPLAKEDTLGLAGVGSLTGIHPGIQVWRVEGGVRRLSDCRRLCRASWESPPSKGMSLDSQSVKTRVEVRGESHSALLLGPIPCALIPPSAK